MRRATPVRQSEGYFWFTISEYLKTVFICVVVAILTNRLFGSLCGEARYGGWLIRQSDAALLRLLGHPNAHACSQGADCYGPHHRICKNFSKFQILSGYFCG
jgi:hypothetical protein